MCREDGCQRRTHPESPYCTTHNRAVLARAFGRAVRAEASRAAVDRRVAPSPPGALSSTAAPDASAPVPAGGGIR